ncbi:MAG: tol-pal system protein YbgF, partial [Candidatus Eisenbacteria bacterium]|nr:tol-pal system protein YbgF [Candidatus Eisenbacteria bacterium]
LAALALTLAAGAAPGCVAPQLGLIRSGLDSLRVVVDTLTVRDSVAFTVLRDTRRELGEQRDILLSTRATSGNTTQELFDQMGRLNNKLDEVMGRFQQISQRAGPPAANPATPAGPGAAPAQPQGDPNQIYDQAAQDLTQGHYALALQGFRGFVRRFPSSDLADNAQYGVGESFFAQSQFDSAATEYAKVEAQWPKGDKVPAALYKQALSREKLGARDAAKKLLEDLVRRFPEAGEAQLARERLGLRDRK